MYVRLIDSDFLWQSHKIVSERVRVFSHLRMIKRYWLSLPPSSPSPSPSQLPGSVKLPPTWQDCAGPPSVCDLHVEEIKVPEQMKPLSNSVEVAHFQFSDPKMNPDLLHAPTSVPVTATGMCHGVVIWWDIMLGDHTLSMDPWDYGQWRDHWLQAVQLWPTPVRLEKGL